MTTEEPAKPWGPQMFGSWAHGRALGMILWYAAVVLALVLADSMCLWLARLPVSVRVAPDKLTVRADGQTLAVPVPIAPSAVMFVSGSSLGREFQVDGTDSTNNFTESQEELRQLAGNPYYQFQAWMRGNSSYSQWRDIALSDARTGHRFDTLAAASIGGELAVPTGGVTTLTADLERPESPAQLVFMAGEEPIATLYIDRNSRTLALSEFTATGDQETAPTRFFPLRPLPFAAEVGDTLVRVCLWATLLLGGAVALALALAYLGRVSIGTAKRVRSAPERNAMLATTPQGTPHSAQPSGITARDQPSAQPRWWGEAATRAAAGIAAVSFASVLYVALVQYHAEPHILDASAYYFQAKIFASGQLSAPVPHDLSAFQGPFMVARHGRWFAQYAPATSAALAVGILLHVPWLIEPLLGTAALWGIYLLGRRMFGPWTAVLAVALGALSPFYAYLAASYLSHTVSLACEVYYLVFLLRFVERRRARDLGIAGALLAAMFTARELSATVAGLVSVGWVLAFYGRALWRDRWRVWPAFLAGSATLGLGLSVYVVYNWLQTGNPLLLPRTLFSPSDRYGFGTGVGFYGRHTLAAGLVNLDQLLTSLLIDLYGWPFYLTLALVPLALLRAEGARRWDWFNMSMAACLALALVGYFYHGIYLGPRYLYDAVPFLLLLTARGLMALTVRCQGILHGVLVTFDAHRLVRASRWTVGGLLALLMLCNLGFYVPRQIALYQNFSGLPASQPVDVAAIYATHLHHALVVTDDWLVYNYVLWPLNDPDLRGDMLYALARGPADEAQLRTEYPNRTLYSLTIDVGGHVSFQRLSS